MGDLRSFDDSLVLRRRLDDVWTFRILFDTRTLNLDAVRG